MPSSPRAIVTIAFIAAGALAASGSAATTADGAGAALPAIAYQSWCATSGLCTYAVRDSGNGLLDLAQGRADWAGVDEELSASQAKAMNSPVAYYPTLLAAIAVPVNIPGVAGHRVRLTGTNLGEIFSGAITTWNDRRIAVTNPRHRFPALPITVCVPDHPSGNSYDFSDYLAKVSATYRRKVGGASMEPRWKAPTLVRLPHVNDVGTCVEQTPGAISFMGLADALRAGLAKNVVAVGKSTLVTETRGNEKVRVRRITYLHPTEDAIVAAGHFAASKLKDDLTVDLTNSPARGAYPITVSTWVIVKTNRPMTAATRKTVKYFLGPAAQGMLQGLGFAPLPPSLRTLALRKLAAAR